MNVFKLIKHHYSINILTCEGNHEVVFHVVGANIITDFTSKKPVLNMQAKHPFHAS
jgi:hypothetical protein